MKVKGTLRDVELEHWEGEGHKTGKQKGEYD
jgi:hypothetical protein